jgi:thymidylate synthase (FAD)
MGETAERLERFSSPELDAVLGQVFPTYDKGFIRVVDYMGTEESIVQAARVSYGKGTKSRSDDRGLIRYLLRHSHTTPFEMCELKLHVKVPMDTWRQWIRHRTASVNEYSTRYSEAIDDKAITLPGEWRFQSGSNKQGSGGFLPEFADCPKCGGSPPYVTKDDKSCDCVSGARLTSREARLHRIAAETYQERLAAGVAREQARKDLPLSTYTEAYWKIDLHNLMNGFLSLRLDKHAQKEIRDCAAPIHQVAKLWVPNVYEAFEDYNHRRSAILLTRLDANILHSYINYDSAATTRLATSYGWLERKSDGSLKDNRERAECEAKLTRFGLVMPWALN